MENEQFEIERQKLELERQKLELERQKLEFEQLSTSKKETKVENSIKKPPNVFAIILAVLVLMSLFLPWIAAYGGSTNVLDPDFVRSVGPYGYVFLLLSIGMIVLSYLRHKLAFALGGLNLLIAAIPTIDIIDKLSRVSRFSDFIEGGIGLILFFVALIIYIIVSLFDLKQSDVHTSSNVANNNPQNEGIVAENSTNNVVSSQNEPFDFSTFIKKYQFELLFSFATLFVLINIGTGIKIISTFSQFFWTLMFFAAIPMLIYRSIKMTKTYKLYFAIPLVFLLAYLYSIFSLAIDGFHSSNFGMNYSDALVNTKPIFSTLFNLLIVTSIFIEFSEIKGFKIAEKFPVKMKWIFKPYISILIVLVPFMGTLVYYSLTRHKVSSEELQVFRTTNGFLAGNWYTLNADSTNLKVFRIEQSSNVEYGINNGEIKMTIRYSFFEQGKEMISENSIDTSFMYNEQLKLPLKFKNTAKLISSNENELVTNLADEEGKSITFFKDKSNLEKIVTDKIERKEKEMAEAESDREIVMNGYIGSFPITMSLKLTSTSEYYYDVVGSYFYNDNRGSKIPFKTTFSEVDGQLYIPIKWKSGIETFEGNYYEGSYSGLWSKGNNTYNFSISE